MKIFISWSGPNSHSAALLLRTWLQDVIQYADPFVSSVDIAKGQRWLPEIAAALNDSSFGVICLTPRNVQAPWVMFEAGAISNRFRDESRVSCLLLGLTPTEVLPPLSQFQNTRLERGEVFKLVRDINAVAEKEALSDERLTRALDANWARVESEFKAIADKASVEVSATESAPKRDPVSIAEETLQIVRNLERRLTAEEQATNAANAAVRDRVAAILDREPGMLSPISFYNIGRALAPTDVTSGSIHSAKAAALAAALRDKDGKKKE